MKNKPMLAGVLAFALCAAANPKPITVHAATVRKGKYAPAAGALAFTPGSPDVKASSARTADDVRLREVERQQHDFEAGRKDL